MAKRDKIEVIIEALQMVLTARQDDGKIDAREAISIILFLVRELG